MVRSEVYSHIDTAWSTLSLKRGYHVHRDEPVCIHICALVEKQTFPTFHIEKIPIPENDDFHAVLVGNVDKALYIVDPVYLAWRNPRLQDNPSVERATAFFPVIPGVQIEKHIVDVDYINKNYVFALTKAIHTLISSCSFSG